MLIKIWRHIYYVWKKVGVQLIRREQKYDNNKLSSLILRTFGTSGKNKWSKSLDSRFKKNERNLKLLEDKILQVYDLLNLVFLSYIDAVFSKHLTLVSAYVSITNNLKLTTTFIVMKYIIRTFEILIHNNNFRLGILF